MAYKSDERLSRSAKKFYNAYKNMFDRFSEQNRHNAEVEGGRTPTGKKGKRYIIVNLDNGMQYVEATESKVITGDDASKWGQQVADYINQIIRGGQDFVIQTTDGDFLTITRDTAYKAETKNQIRNPDGTYRTMTDDEYRVKLNAEVHINELSEISVNKTPNPVPDQKNHKFAKDGFTYRTAYFKDFDGKYYQVTISVGENGGVSTVYNVGKIKEDTLPSGNIMSAFSGSKANNASSINSIHENSEFVNTSDKNNQGNALPESLDADYMTAVESGDMETAQRMVDEAARAAGYTDKLYHGTRQFGFTEFDPAFSDDKISIFVAGSDELAQTYSGRYGARNVSDAYKVEGLSIDEIVTRLNDEAAESYEDSELKTEYAIMYQADIKALHGEVDSGIERLQELVEGKIKEYADRMATDFNDSDAKIHKRLVELNEILEYYRYDQMSTPLYMLIHHTDVFKGDTGIEELEYKIRLRNKLSNCDTRDGVVIKKDLDGYGLSILYFDEARELLKRRHSEGNYALYGNPRNQLVIDGRGQNWNDIRHWAGAVHLTKEGTTVERRGDYFRLFDKKTGNEIFHGRLAVNMYTEGLSAAERQLVMIDKANNVLDVRAEYMHTTRDIARFAKDNGYESVKFENILDNGGNGKSVGAGDVYAYFEPNNLKSADPVTYDDEMKVIPLSKRFDSNKRDIRYALPEDVDSRTYSYDEIVAKGDLTGTIIDDTLQVPIKTDSNGYIKIDSSAVFDAVKAQCEQLKTKAPLPTYYVNVPDIGKNVEIYPKAVEHGYAKGLRSKKKSIPPADMLNARISLKLPEILKNSIEINISNRSDNIDIPYSHVMIGTAAIKNSDGTIEYYAVRSVIEERLNQNPILAEARVIGRLHAVNAKKVGSSSVQVVKNGVALRDNDAYTYSIAQFLDDVKGKFDDTFSNDVYTRLGVQRKVNPFSANLRHALPEGVDTDNIEPIVKDGKFGPFEPPFTGTISSVTTEKKDVYKRGVREAANDMALATQVAFTNEQAGVEWYLRQAGMSDRRAQVITQIARAAGGMGSNAAMVAQYDFADFVKPGEKGEDGKYRLLFGYEIGHQFRHKKYFYTFFARFKMLAIVIIA